jgi:hypothetical protein
MQLKFTFTFFILASQHVSAYIEAIFKCGFLSNNNNIEETTTIQRIRWFYHVLFCALFSFQYFKFVMQLYICK